jgi:DNA invertase Pin-like site-specific DNA recombinase
LQQRKTKKMKARYIRISSLTQNEERQLTKSHPTEKFFIDKISGTTLFNQRPQAIELLKAIENKEINYLSIDAIDRLGRNTLDIFQTLDFLKNNNVTVKVENLGIESKLPNGTPNPVFNLITSVLANIAEMERLSMLERQKQGIAIAKAKGVYKGREKGSTTPNDEILKKYSNVVKLLQSDKKNTLKEIAVLGGCTINTVQKVKKILNE